MDKGKIKVCHNITLLNPARFIPPKKKISNSDPYSISFRRINFAIPHIDA